MPLDMGSAQQYVQNQQQQAAASGKRDILNYKYRPGQNRGRLLPPWPGSGELAMHIWHHTKVPPGKTHFFCWENMFPGKGVQCPICAVCKKLRAMGFEPWQQEAWDSPQTNWIDRQPLNQFGQPLALDQHPGPQIIDLDINLFNYLMNTAVTTGCDLTALDLGYDIIINHDPNVQKKRDAYQPMIVPGAAMPLAVNPELAKHWLGQCYDLRQLKKMPVWNEDKGRTEWAKLCASANELERMYTQGGGVQVPVGQFPPGGPMAPQFSQPTGGPPTAPPPQFGAPAPQFGAPMPPMAPPPMAAPSMMGQPEQLPFGAPAMPAPTGYQPPPPPAYTPPPAPVAAPPAMPAAPQAPQYTPPPAPPQQAPQTFQPPQAPQAPAPPVMPPAPMPPAPPVMPAPAQAPPVDNRPPWEAQVPAVPQAGFPPQPPNLGVPTPPAMPAAPPATAPAPAASMTQTSVDGKPPCFAHSRLDMSVEYGATGQAPVKGGYSDDPQEVGYRCMMCPQSLDCSAKAAATYPDDYAKQNNVYVKLKTA